MFFPGPMNYLLTRSNAVTVRVDGLSDFLIRRFRGRPRVRVFPAASLPAYDSSKAHSWSSREIRGTGLMGRGRVTVPIGRAGGRSTAGPKEDHR